MDASELALGTTVSAADDRGEWTVVVLDVEWRDGPCDDTYRDNGPVVVVDLRFEVLTGELMGFPGQEFRYLDSAGQSSGTASQSGCEDLGHAFHAVAGEVVTGTIAFEADPSLVGEIIYGRYNDLDDIASWEIPVQR